ncbi:MAG: hypothetical protein CL610_00965 [Anaerolineaceae bacterium]|nr:hypothetical protein [Anaerolineaceae bacterium]
MSDALLQQIKQHWGDLRGRTYDLLDVLQPEDFPKRLPFAESQSVYYQFWCMLGTTESFARLIEAGTWQGWASSLNFDPAEVSAESIKAALRQSDETLFAALAGHDLLQPYGRGATPLRHYFRLVEHESHHHGQLINFIYALNLPIPQSWADEWALSREA